MAAGKVIQAVLRLQDNMSGGILKAARNAKKAGADINKDMMRATRQVVAWKNKALSSIDNAVSKMGKLAIAGAAAGAAFSIKTGMEFEAQMSKVKAISGATVEDMKALTAKAKEMGAKTKFSAVEAGQGLEYMAMAGWKTKAMLNALPPVMSLAAATATDLGTTSDIITDAMTALGIGSEGAAHFADVLAIATSSANTTLEQMGETFKYCASVGGAFKISAEEIALSIGLMANSSTKSSEAGTSTRSILSRLATDSGGAQTALKKLGVSFYDSAGAMRPYGQILAETREKWKGLTAEEGANLALKIAGKNALSGWYALMNASADDWNKVTWAINGCNGAAENMMEIMNDNLAGDITILQSTIQAVGIEFYEAFGKTGRNAVQTLTKKISALVDNGTIARWAQNVGASIEKGMKLAGDAIQWCKEHSDGLKNTLKALAGAYIGIKTANFATGILNTGKTLVNFGKTVRAVAMTALPDMTGVVQTAIGPLDMSRHHTLIGGIKTAFSGIGSSVKTGLASVGKFVAANPVVLVIAGIVTACVLLYRHSEKFRNFVNNLVSSIKAKLAPALESAKEFFGKLVEKFKTDVIPFLKTVGDKAAELGGQLIAFLAPKIQSVIEWVKQLANSFLYWIAPAFQAFKQIAETVGKVFQTSIAPALGKMISALGTLAGTVLTYAVPAVKKLVEIGVKISTAYTATVVPILGRLLGVLVKIAGWVIEHVVPAVAGFISIAVTLASKFIEFVSPAVSWLAEKVSELAGWITAHVVPAVGGFLDEAGKLATALGKTLFNAVQWLIDKLTALKNFLMKTLSPVIDFIKGAFDAVRQTVGKLIDKIKEFLGMDTKKTIDVSFRETVGNTGQVIKGMYINQVSGLDGRALGTNYWRGGLVRVNERGGEIMNLPSGTQIIPHDISEKMVGGNTNNTNVTVNLYGMDVRNPRQLGEIVVAEIMRQIHNTP